MIWSHKARMNWVCNDIKGLTAEVYTADKIWFWKVTSEKGKIISRGKAIQPMDAMDDAKACISAIVGVRDGIEA